MSYTSIGRPTAPTNTEIGRPTPSNTDIGRPTAPTNTEIGKPSYLASPIIDCVSSLINSVDDTIDDYSQSIYENLTKPTTPSYTSIAKPTL